MSVNLPRGGERAVSTNVGYALTLGIATILITGLVVGGGSFLDKQREQTVEKELTVIGQQLAADISAADRLARTDDASTVRIRRDLPDRVVGGAYSVTVVTSGDDEHLRLVATDQGVTVELDVQVRKEIVSSTVQGGTVEIVYDAGADQLEVRDG